MEDGVVAKEHKDENLERIKTLHSSFLHYKELYEETTQRVRTLSDLDVIAIQRSNELLIENQKIKTILKDEIKLKSYLQNEIAHQEKQAAVIWNKAKMSSSEENTFDRQNSLIRLDINEVESSSQEDVFANCFTTSQHSPQKKRFIFREKSGNSMDTFSPPNITCSSGKLNNPSKFEDSSLETFRVKDNIFFRSNSSGNSMDTFAPPRCKNFTPAISRDSMEFYKEKQNKNPSNGSVSPNISQVQTGEVFQNFSPEQRNVYRARSGGVISRRSIDHNKQKLYKSRSGDAFQSFEIPKNNSARYKDSTSFDSTRFSENFSDKFNVSSYDGSLEPFMSPDASGTKFCTSSGGATLQLPNSSDCMPVQTSTPISKDSLDGSFPSNKNSCKRKLNFDHYLGNSMSELHAKDSCERNKTKQYRASKSSEGIVNRAAQLATTPFQFDFKPFSGCESTSKQSEDMFQHYMDKVSSANSELPNNGKSMDNFSKDNGKSSLLFGQNLTFDKCRHSVLPNDSNTNSSSISITVTDTDTGKSAIMNDSAKISPQTSCTRCQSTNSVRSRATNSNNSFCAKRQSKCKYSSLDVLLQKSGKDIETKDSNSSTITLSPNSSNSAMSLTVSNMVPSCHSDFTYSDRSSCDDMELRKCLSNCTARSMQKDGCLKHQSSSKELLLKCSDQTSQSALCPNKSTQNCRKSSQCFSPCFQQSKSRGSIRSGISKTSSKQMDKDELFNNDSNASICKSTTDSIESTSSRSMSSSESMNSDKGLSVRECAKHSSESMPRIKESDRCAGPISVSDNHLGVNNKPSSRGCKSFNSFLWAGNGSDTFGAMACTDSTFRALLKGNGSSDDACQFHGSDEKENKPGDQEESRLAGGHVSVNNSDNSLLKEASKKAYSDNFLLNFSSEFFENKGESIVNTANVITGKDSRSVNGSSVESVINAAREKSTKSIAESRQKSDEFLKLCKMASELIKSMSNRSLQSQASGSSTSKESKARDSHKSKLSKKISESLQSLSTNGLQLQNSNHSSYSNSSDTFALLSDSDRGSKIILKSLESLLSGHGKSLSDTQFGYLSESELGLNESVKSISSGSTEQNHSARGSKESLSQESSISEDSNINRMVISLLQTLSREESLRSAANYSDKSLSSNEFAQKNDEPKQDKSGSSKELVKDCKSENTIDYCSSEIRHGGDLKVKPQLVVEEDTTSYDQNEPMTSILTKHLHKIMDSLNLGGSPEGVDFERAIQSIPSINLDSNVTNSEVDVIQKSVTKQSVDKQESHEVLVDKVSDPSTANSNESAEPISNGKNHSDIHHKDQNSYCAPVTTRIEGKDLLCVADNNTNCNSERQIILANVNQQCTSSTNDVMNKHTSADNTQVWGSSIPTMETLLERLDLLDRDLTEKTNELSQTKLERDTLSTRIEEIESSFHAITDQRYSDNIYLRNSLVRVETSIDACQQVLASTIEQKTCLKEMLDYLNTKIEKDKDHIEKRKL